MSCQCGSAVKDDRFVKIDQILDLNGRDESFLIQNLEQIQNALGYLPEDVQAVFCDVGAHRLVIRQRAKISGADAMSIAQEILSTVERPEIGTHKGKKL